MKAILAKKCTLQLIYPMSKTKMYNYITDQNFLSTHCRYGTPFWRCAQNSYLGSNFQNNRTYNEGLAHKIRGRYTIYTVFFVFKCQYDFI